VEHPALTYTSYLHVDELLACQEPLSDGPEHDELLFIVIHQVYELWFKVLLHEAEHLQRALETGDTATALAAMKRILTILKTVVAQVDVLETMTPLAFASFRGRLERPLEIRRLVQQHLEPELVDLVDDDEEELVVFGPVGQRLLGRQELVQVQVGRVGERRVLHGRQHDSG